MSWARWRRSESALTVPSGSAAGLVTGLAPPDRLHGGDSPPRRGACRRCGGREIDARLHQARERMNEREASPARAASPLTPAAESQVLAGGVPHAARQSSTAARATLRAAVRSARRCFADRCASAAASPTGRCCRQAASARSCARSEKARPAPPLRPHQAHAPRARRQGDAQAPLPPARRARNSASRSDASSASARSNGAAFKPAFDPLQFTKSGFQRTGDGIRFLIDTVFRSGRRRRHRAMRWQARLHGCPPMLPGSGCVTATGVPQRAMAIASVRAIAEETVAGDAPKFVLQCFQPRLALGNRLLFGQPHLRKPTGTAPGVARRRDHRPASPSRSDGPRSHPGLHDAPRQGYGVAPRAQNHGILIADQRLRAAHAPRPARRPD